MTKNNSTYAMELPSIVGQMINTNSSSGKTMTAIEYKSGFSFLTYSETIDEIKKKTYIQHQKIFTRQKAIDYFLEKQSLKVNDKVYDVMSKLIDVIDEIKRSEYILTLKDGWDGEDGIPIESEIYDSSINLLVKYSNHVLSKYNLPISAPEINPCKNGSIDLSWRTVYARFLINVRKINGKVLAYYYGDFYNNANPKSGILNPNDLELNMATANWMKNLK